MIEQESTEPKKSPNEWQVTPDEWHVIECAVSYSLLNKSHCRSLVTDYVKKHFHRANHSARRLILMSVLVEIKRHDRYRKVDKSFSLLGREEDVQAWRDFLKWIEDNIST